MIDHGHAKGEWMISYRYMNMTMRGNITGSQKISNEKIYQNYLMSNQQMTMQMHMAMMMYGVSDKITLMAMGNYSVNSMEMAMMMYGNHIHGGSSMSGDMEMKSKSHVSGFSDTELYLLYSILSRGKHQLVASAGVSIPTGSISLSGINMTGDIQKFTYSMQTGTGSWGLLPGITYTVQGKNYSWGFQGLADVKTNKNKAGYKFGNKITGNAWVSRKWNSWLSNSIRLSTIAAGKINGFDADIAPFRTTDPDADTKNSGSFYSSVYAGVNVAMQQGFLNGSRLGLEYGIPFYQYAQGIQTRKQGLFIIGFQYSF
jgi:hypothetical protein